MIYTNFESFIRFISNKFDYDYKITEFSVIFYKETYIFSSYDIEYLFGFDYKINKKEIFCFNFFSDFTYQKVKQNNYIDFLSDSYNIFKNTIFKLEEKIK